VRIGRAPRGLRGDAIGRRKVRVVGPRIVGVRVVCLQRMRGLAPTIRTCPGSTVCAHDMASVIVVGHSEMTSAAPAASLIAVGVREPLLV
jgi:hypothetical protein